MESNQSTAGPAFFSLFSMGLAASGLVVAGTLSVAHTLHKTVPCGTNSGCETVANSSLSTIAGIPVAYLGVGGYLLLLGLGLVRALFPAERRIAFLGLVVAFVGASFSSWLLWQSVSVLHATCNWCLASAGVMFALLGVNAVGLGGWMRRPLPRRFLFGSLGVLLLASLGGTVASSRFLREPSEEQVLRLGSLADLIPPYAPALGDPSSPVTIVEFADLNCPACREMQPRLERVVEHHPGRVRLVFRHLPLSDIRGHETSHEAAVLSNVAAQSGAFWAFVDRWYAGKPPVSLAQLLRSESGNGVPASHMSQIRQIAEERLAADVGYAARIGARQTPTYVVIVDGRMVGSASNLNLLQLLEGPEVARYLR